MIDSEYRDVVWVDAKHPSAWDKKVYDQLNEAWRASEGIEEYYIDEIKPVPDVKVDNLDALKVIDSLKAIIEKDKRQKEIQKLQKQIDSLNALKENQ